MSAVSDAPHRLLLTHFTSWLKTKGRDVDIQLLEDLLDLRAAYDDLEPTYWPAGSVNDLLVRLVPAKGPTEPLPSHAVADALDAYFRFLRSTGRMSAQSATPADLSKEARRSAKKMVAAARDRSNWSTGKSLIDFGSSIGISLDDLDSVDQLQDRLDQISAAWNDLPISERQRLDPPPGDLSGRERAMAAYQTDIEVVALIRAFAYEFPQGELPSSGQVAPLIREAGLLGQLEALTRWIAPRAEVTATGVLRPAAARRAYEDLGLDDWWRGWLRLGSSAARFSGDERDTVVNRLASAQSWRSARDCLPLDRLWNAALSSRVIRIEGRWAYAAWPDELDDEAIVNIGIDAGIDQLFNYFDEDLFVGTGAMGYALLRSYVRRPHSVPLTEIADFAEAWVLAPSELDGPESHIYRSLINSTLRRGLYHFRDLGILSQTENEIALTSWGDVFVSAWLNIELGPDEEHPS